MVLVPKLFHDEIAFCGVFDGTVGPHASEFLKQNFIDVMLQMGEMQQVSFISFVTMDDKSVVVNMKIFSFIVDGNDKEREKVTFA